jgi:flavin reductase (DIM6/NTAB) family NADH-FMN oxidoreductase RutF
MINKYKLAMSSYPTGIVCVTIKSNNKKYNSIIANSFNSVSLKPSIVSWCLDKNSGKYDLFKNSKKQLISILGGDQRKSVSEIAFKKEEILKSEIEEIKKKSVFNFYTTKLKSLIIGDHCVIFLKVNKISTLRKKSALVYYQRKLLNFKNN